MSTQIDLGARLVQLAAERPELGIDLSSAGSALPRLSAIASDSSAIARWLDLTCQLAEDIDRRTAAAYLLSILVWRLGELLAALHLSPTQLPALSADHIGAELLLRGEPGRRDVVFRLHIDAEGPVGRPGDVVAMRATVLAIHAPLIEALAETGLSRSALWRLVTDGITGGWLFEARRLGDVERAMVDAAAIVALPPLANPQWRFVDAAQPGRPPRWFRLRGGCCRLYRSAGNDYCTTCVVRTPEDQIARLEAFVRRRDAKAEAG